MITEFLDRHMNRSCSLFTGLALLLCSSLPVHSQSADSFNPDVSNYTRSLAVQADGKIVIGGNYGIGKLNPDGSLDTDFNLKTNGTVFSLVVQSDGKILVGGDFTNMGGQPRNNIARFNADGSLDAGFNPMANSTIYSLAVQTDGKILVGGQFTNIGGQARYRIARLNSDGSLDTGFNPTAGARVYSLALQADGKILVGGDFSGLGGQARNFIGRLNADGSLDTGFNPNASSTVYSLALQPDGKVLMGGVFTNIGGQMRNYAARLNSDGSLDTSFDPNPNHVVFSLALQADGRILTGGMFTAIGGQPRMHIARLNANGSLDTGFDPNANNSVYSLALSADGKILVGGSFTNIGGQARNFIARLTNDTPPMAALAVTSTVRIDWIRGGSTPELSQVAFASWNGGGWSNLGNATRVPGGWSMTGLTLPASGWVRVSGITNGGQSNSSSGFVAQTTHYGSGLYPDIAVNVEGIGNVASGATSVDFGTVDWTSSAALTKIISITNEGTSPLNGLSLSLTGAQPTDFSVESLPTSSLAPGASMSFSVGFLPGSGGLRGCTLTIGSDDIDESPFRLPLQGTGNYCDLAFAPNASSVVYSATLQTDGKILVGGMFTSIGGQSHNFIARLNADGTADVGFNPNANDRVFSLTVQEDGKILVGGMFTSIGGQPRNGIARLNSDGSLDANFDPNASGDYHTVAALAVQPDGKILMGGQFTTIGSQPRNRIARINSDGRLDADFNPSIDYFVNTLAVQGDGKILVGGSFTSIDGQTRNYLARLDADGNLDMNFDPNANGTVYALVLQADGKILAAGNFTSIHGQMRNRIARLNADGGLDTGFDPNSDNSVQSMTLQSDGKILVGGNFATIGGQMRNRLARLKADGSLDTQFNPNASSTVYSLALQADGKILAGGPFTTIGGHLARLTNNTAATSSLSVTGIDQVDWTRSGAAPEVSQVTFESWDGSAWTLLGNASRISGGWRATGLTLPASGQIRARGRTNGGQYNGSSGFVEQTTTYMLPPDIAVEEPTGTKLSTGSESACGVVITGSTAAKIYTIRNTGPSTLNIGTISLTGANASDFAVGTLGDSSVVPGGQTTLQITFSPSSSGEKNATLSILSDDPDENPFVLTITGTGVTGKNLFDNAMVSTGLKGANLQPGASPFGDGVSNLLKYAFNMNLAAPDCRKLDPNIGTAGLPTMHFVSGTLRYEYMRRKNSGLTYTPQQSSALETDNWQHASGNFSVTSIDAIWERVVIEKPFDTARSPKLFLRLLITLE